MVGSCQYGLGKCIKRVASALLSDTFVVGLRRHTVDRNGRESRLTRKEGEIFC